MFSHPEFDDHETVLHGFDATSGLRAIIAVHSTRLGPALGGCRMYPYADDAEALTDVLRLSRGMSYKAALARLPQGGGKSVILGDPRADKTPARMRAMGMLVARMQGRYIVAEDSGITVADIHHMAEHTAHVSGILAGNGAHDGNPSPATARGTLLAIRTCAERVLGSSDLTGVRIAIQGTGAVGARLAALLAEAGARLWVADVHAPSAAACAEATGAALMTPEAILEAPVDIVSPCAMGAVLNAQSIPRLQAKAVAGAANNQLATAEDDARLRDAGIVYAPDYVVNAGGIIDIHYQRIGVYDPQAVAAHLALIPETLRAIFERADTEGRPTGQVADTLARARIAQEV